MGSSDRGIAVEGRTEDFLTACSSADFGAVCLADGERKFASDLNGEIVLLCKSLPESTQTDALLFLMQYTGTSIGDESGFLRYYYPPTWSILYWLVQSGPNRERLKEENIRHAKTAHAMAMLLHPLDDHLKDGQLPVTHLNLLLRSQAWLGMNRSAEKLAAGIENGEALIGGYIDDYYSGMRSHRETASLDSYCAQFRKQMAIGLISPVLIMRRMTTDASFHRAVETAYGSFGIAWRLLDDIKDIETDRMQGNHSAVYVCLPEDLRKGWDENGGAGVDESSGYRELLVDHLRVNRVIDSLVDRIRNELEKAASFMDAYDMKGLAAEFRCLLNPANGWQIGL
jgi:hypothetical protein